MTSTEITVLAFSTFVSGIGVGFIAFLMALIWLSKEIKIIRFSEFEQLKKQCSDLSDEVQRLKQSQQSTNQNRWYGPSYGENYPINLCENGTTFTDPAPPGFSQDQSILGQKYKVNV